MSCMREADLNGICPHCGHDNFRANHNDLSFLQPGDIVASRYIAGVLKRRNGESAWYIGYDSEAKSAVWICEYFPGAISTRIAAGTGVIPKPGRGAQYKALMSDFVDLCNVVRRLSVSDAVIPIEHMISDNNTLYAIYKSLDVISLERWFSTPAGKASGGRLPVRRALKMFAPLLDTLGNMHARGDIHRGISPSTVYIGRDGKLYLWGFAISAARTGGSELDAELFDGYSAPEQYMSNGWQGTWTDVYAIAALFYRVVTGITPKKSTDINPSRPLPLLRDLIEDMPNGISGAVYEAMQTSKAHRTQTITSFASKMSVNENFADTAATAVFKIDRKANTPEAEPIGQSRSQNRRKKDSEGGVSVKYVILTLFCTILILAGSMWFVMTRYFPDLVSGNGDPPPRQSQSVSQAPAPESRSEPKSSPSSAAEDKSIPNFIGKNAEDLSNDAQYENRYKFELRYEFDEAYEQGAVFDQAPPPGEVMLNKGTVILYVSKGKLEITMPDLTGKSVDEAMEIFNGLSKEYGVDYLSFQTVEKYDSQVEGGKIISSIPVAGMAFNPKTTSVLVYVALQIEVSETKEISTSGRRVSSRPSNG